MKSSFHEQFMELFDQHYHRLRRYLSRLSGDPDLAADLAQDTFVRLYQRRSPPDSPEAWLITVGTNLFRNARTKEARRNRLLTPAMAEESHSEAPRSPAEVADADSSKRRVSVVLARMPERERRMLLLSAEGYGYREIAAAVGINETSVGTLLARAKRAFRQLHEEMNDASR